MKLAIMQPYFFPYLGYFALIKHTDHFMVFDTPQFIRHGWIERNRILKPNEGWHYIKVPLEKHGRETVINEICIKNSENWKEKILAQLTHYKKSAKYYKDTVTVVQDVFKFDTNSIVDLNNHALKTVCNYLDISTEWSVFSKLNLKIIQPEAPDEWALNISLAMNAKEYINPPGGESFFNRNKYAGRDLKLSFLQFQITEYNQKRDDFEPGLSIIDALMFNSPTEINEMLNKYSLK